MGVNGVELDQQEMGFSGLLLLPIDELVEAVDGRILDDAHGTGTV
jgi:hypothetical protein